MRGGPQGLYLEQVNTKDLNIFTPQCGSLNIHPLDILLQYEIYIVLHQFAPLYRFSGGDEIV